MLFHSDRRFLIILTSLVLCLAGAATLIQFLPEQEKTPSDKPTRSAPIRVATEADLMHSSAAELQQASEHKIEQERVALFLGEVVVAPTTEQVLADLQVLAHQKPPAIDAMLKLILAAQQNGLLSSRKALIEALGEAMVERIALHALDTELPTAQKWALLMFGTMRSATAVPQIISLVRKNGDEVVQKRALDALSQINSDEGIAFLREVIFTEGYPLRVRREGVHALAETYHKGRLDVYDDLVASIDPAQEEILRAAGVRVISKIHNDEVRDRLSVVAHHDPSGSIRSDALLVLSREFIQDRDAYASVFRSIESDPDEQVRLRAMTSIVLFNNPEVVPLLAHLATQNKSYAKTGGNAMARLDPTRALDLLNQSLMGGNEETRLNIIEAIAVIRTQRSQEILTRLIQSDESEEVRHFAVKALAVQLAEQ